MTLEELLPIVSERESAAHLMDVGEYVLDVLWILWIFAVSAIVVSNTFPFSSLPV